jgi:hypothetical protein
VERVLEDALDPVTDRRVEPLEREVDEAGEKSAEDVVPDEEANPPPLAEMEDPERDVVELVLSDLEELLSRIALQDLDQRLVVVASEDESASVDDALRLPAQHRDLPRARSVHGVGIEAKEAALA